MKTGMTVLGATVMLLSLILLGGCAKKAVRPIFDIAKDGTPQEMQAALDRAKGTNANDLESGAGETVLMYAAQFNKNPEVTALLLKAGADLWAKDGDRHRTALIWAAQSTANPDVITTLVKAGADIRETDKDGFTPLMIAAVGNGNPEVIARLVSSGADLEAKDQNGFTALMEAASKNHNPDVIVALLKAGANAKAKNNKGYTPLDYAKANRGLDGTNALKQLEEASK